MMRQIILTIITFLVILCLSNCSKSSNDEEPTGGEVFKAVHLLNLQPEASEAEMLQILNELNAVIAELGYPNIKYRLWKERGDKQGKYKYIFDSTWQNQEIYDKVHNSEKYKRMIDWIAKDLGVTTLRYQILEDMVQAIGLPKEKLCMYCWTGKGVQKSLNSFSE